MLENEGAEKYRGLAEKDSTFGGNDRCHLEEQATITKVLLDNDIIDSRHDKPYLGGIGGAGEVGINLLRLVLVQGNESVQDIVAGRGIIRSTFIIREIVLHRGDREFLLKPVDLVQKQDDRGLDKPSGVADRVKECESFLHSVDGFVFEEQLIVLGDGNEEKDGGDVLKAVDPFLPLGSLTSDIEHAVGKLADDESSLSNTSGLHSRSQNILVVW